MNRAISETPTIVANMTVNTSMLSYKSTSCFEFEFWRGVDSPLVILEAVCVAVELCCTILRDILREGGGFNEMHFHGIQEEIFLHLTQTDSSVNVSYIDEFLSAAPTGAMVQ